MGRIAMAHLGKMDDAALKAYERAGGLILHMECVRQTVEEMKGRR